MGEVLVGLVIGLIFGCFATRAWDYTTVEDYQKENKQLRKDNLYKNNAEQRAMTFARKIKSIEDILIKAEQTKENYFITLEKIKKELLMTAKSTR